jgi:hypothetical protein
MGGPSLTWVIGNGLMGRVCAPDPIGKMDLTLDFSF